MKRHSIRGVTLVAAALVASPALLAESKNYSGATCKPADSTDSYFSDAQGAKNRVDRAWPGVNFVCPIVRDFSSSANSLGSLAVEYYNANDGLSETATYAACIVWTMDDDGDSGLVVDYEFRESSSVGNRQFSFSNLSSTLTTNDANEGGYLLTCHIGLNDRINQIQVVESNGSD